MWLIPAGKMGYAHGTARRASVPESPLQRHVVSTVGKIMHTEGNVERQDRGGFCLFHSLILEERKLRPVSWSDDPGLHS